MTRATTACLLLCCAASLSALALITVEQEIEIGRQAQGEVRRQVPELRDQVVARYVTGIGRRLTARARGAKYPYSFTVANQREINAFALPGGPVWIHRGAIAAAANEAQLAAVLAHEIAHISQRHAADRVTQQLVANGLIGVLGALLGNDTSAQRAQIGARILAGGYMLKFSRDDEREADAVGATIMRQAGWDSRQMAAFLRTLEREQGKGGSQVTVFLSSHPAPGERAERLRASVRSGGAVDSQAFRAIKARLAKLPPAPAMKQR